jgi:glycosyltransferase involved in cell wall biosynthesis
MSARDRGPVAAGREATRPAVAVTVTVPVRDEESSLAVLLESLLAQTHAPAEIVLADGGSTDRTAEVAAAYAARGVRVLPIGPAYPGHGRNAAIRAARTEWVALVDAGCWAAPTWLAELVGRLEGDPTLEAVLGDFQPMLRDEWDRAQALALIHPRDPADGTHPPVTVSALLKRELFERLGGFREDLRAAEDLIFLQALQASGARIARAPRAIVTWRLAAGPRAVWRRLSLYSYHHLRAGQFRTWHRRVLLMDTAFLALLVGGVFAPVLLAVAVGAGALRTGLTAHKRRTNLPEPHPLSFSRLLKVAVLLVLADAAAWRGAYNFLATRLAR